MIRLLFCTALCLALTGCSQDFTVRNYPSPDDFLTSWNHRAPGHLRVDGWAKMDPQVLMGSTDEGMSLAFNSRNRAFGVIAENTDRQFPFACQTLYSMFLGGSGKEASNAYARVTAQSGLVKSITKIGIKFRVFINPSNGSIICNVSPEV